MAHVGTVRSRPSTVGNSLHVARIPKIAEFLLADEARLEGTCNQITGHGASEYTPRPSRARIWPIKAEEQRAPVPNGWTRRRRKLAWTSTPHHVEVENAIERHTQPHLGKPRAD